MPRTRAGQPKKEATGNRPPGRPPKQGWRSRISPGKGLAALAALVTVAGGIVALFRTLDPPRPPCSELRNAVISAQPVVSETLAEYNAHEHKTVQGSPNSIGA